MFCMCGRGVHRHVLHVQERCAGEMCIAMFCIWGRKGVPWHVPHLQPPPASVGVWGVSCQFPYPLRQFPCCFDVHSQPPWLAEFLPCWRLLGAAIPLPRSPEVLEEAVA